MPTLADADETADADADRASRCDVGRVHEEALMTDQNADLAAEEETRPEVSVLVGERGAEDPDYSPDMTPPKLAQEIKRRCSEEEHTIPLGRAEGPSAGQPSSR